MLEGRGILQRVSRSLQPLCTANRLFDLINLCMNQFRPLHSSPLTHRSAAAAASAAALSVSSRTFSFSARSRSLSWYSFWAVTSATCGRVGARGGWGGGGDEHQELVQHEPVATSGFAVLLSRAPTAAQQQGHPAGQQRPASGTEPQHALAEPLHSPRHRPTCASSSAMRSRRSSISPRPTSTSSLKGRPSPSRRLHAGAVQIVAQ